MSMKNHCTIHMVYYIEYIYRYWMTYQSVNTNRTAFFRYNCAFCYFDIFPAAISEFLSVAYTCACVNDPLPNRSMSWSKNTS